MNKKKYNDFILSELINKVENIFLYTGFLKQYMRYNSCSKKIGDYIQKNGSGRNVTYKFKNNSAKNYILNKFPFLNDNNELAKHLWNYKNDDFELFPFDWLKNEILKTKFNFDKEEIQTLSGIIDGNSEEELQNKVNSLIPYSFILHVKVYLTAPYFSSDDDNFYLIQNPCLKEKVFKVPMVRGSGWKGAIASGFRELINESDNKQDLIQSYLRIFGTGSKEFRELEETVKGFVEKGKSLSGDAIVKFLLFELGLKLTKDDILKIKNENEREDFLKTKLWGDLTKNSKKEIPNFLQTHKGRAIFYPTYFDKLSLEIINPHSRKTRAGTSPIHYEVVPGGTEGILQIVYIPFDGVLSKNDKVKEETKKDLDNLIKALEKTKENGIGAKEKLGWGRFRIINIKIENNYEDF